MQVVGNREQSALGSARRWLGVGEDRAAGASQVWLSDGERGRAYCARTLTASLRSRD